jgi:glycosyltransferase involved in cell wall biosynthesis
MQERSVEAVNRGFHQTFYIDEAKIEQWLSANSLVSEFFKYQNRKRHIIEDLIDNKDFIICVGRSYRNASPKDQISKESMLAQTFNRNKILVTNNKLREHQPERKKLSVLYVYAERDIYPDSLKNLHELLAGLEGFQITFVQIDNLAEEKTVIQNKPNVFDIGGDNSNREFSGWQRGLKFLESADIESDILLFVNDSFLNRAPKGYGLDYYKSKINTISLSELSENEVLGKVDFHDQVETFDGYDVSSWIRSNIFVIPKTVIKKLGFPCIDKDTIDRIFPVNFPGRIFNSDNHLLNDYFKEWLKYWITSGWSRSSPINKSNWQFFRDKLVAILNERILTLKLKRAGIKIVDFDRVKKRTYISRSNASLPKSSSNNTKDGIKTSSPKIFTKQETPKIHSSRTASPKNKNLIKQTQAPMQKVSKSMEQMQAAQMGTVPPSEQVNIQSVKDRDNAGSLSQNKNLPDYSQLSEPNLNEPLRITFISINIPRFDMGSSNLRISHILKILVRKGYKIDYLYFGRYEDELKYKAAFDDAVDFIRVPPRIDSLRDYLHYNKVEKLGCLWITNLWSVNYLDFAFQLTQWLKHNHHHVRVIIDTMDFHYKKFMRKFHVSNDSQDLLKAEQFLELEKKLYPLADWILTVSEAEKHDICASIGSDCNVSVIPNIHTIPALGPAIQQRKHICFIGGFHVTHNVDAVKWFLKEVFPLIAEKAPQVQFHILGFDSEKFKGELEVNPNVKVIGYVEDAESAVANYRLFVCPMTYGAGMKGKLGTAAAVGTPIVTTTIGAEGFDFVDGQNCFIADEPQSFANKCLRLLNEDSLWSQFSTKAKDMVAERFSIKAVSGRINAFLQQITKVKSEGGAIGDSVKASLPRDYVAPEQYRARPKVSIITSCYNSGRFLPECIDSILNQTMQEWELLLIDDGSTDGTREIIEEYNRMDERIRTFYSQENKGPYFRRNFGIEQAASDFIVIQDADDIMCPSKLQTLYNEITKDEQLGIVGSFYYNFLEEFEGFEYSEQCKLALSHEEIMRTERSRWNFCSHGSAIIRKRLFDEIGLYDENPFGSDSIWLAKATEYAHYAGSVRFKNIPEFLTLRRVHANSQTGMLPTFDPRSRRVKFVTYWQDKICKIRERIHNNFGVDIAAELRNCQCSDFTTKYGHLFDQWESEPLDKEALLGLVKRAVVLFQKGAYVTCISVLNSLERNVPGLASKLKNLDLLRAKAYFAVGKKERCLIYLEREIQNHDNPTAREFLADHHSSLTKIAAKGGLRSFSEVGLFQNEPVASDDSTAMLAERTKDNLNSTFNTETEPLVSIVIPAYNAGQYIQKAIESVLAQTYKNFELIIVDDGSKDTTKDRVYSYRDSRITYLYQDRTGLASACNTAIRKIKGSFWIRLKAEDMITPDFISRHLREFEQLPEADLVYCDDCLIDEDGNSIRTIDRPEYTNRTGLIRDFFHQGFPTIPFGTCVRIDVFDKIGMFDESLIIAESYDMMRRFVKHGLTSRHLKEALYLRRMTSDIILRDKSAEKANCYFDVIERFTDTFGYEELFPDVNWGAIVAEKRKLHAKCLAAIVFVELGRVHTQSNSPNYTGVALDRACSKLRDVLGMDPENTEVHQLLQQCDLAREESEKLLCELPC